MDLIEASTCCYAALLLSERAIRNDLHTFLTTGRGNLYRAIKCRVQLDIGSWADLPRCFAAYDDALGPRPDRGPIGYKRSAVEKHVDAMAGPNKPPRLVDPRINDLNLGRVRYPEPRFASEPEGEVTRAWIPWAGPHG